MEALLRDSGRRGRAVPIRRAFAQQGEQRAPRPGPLAALVRAGDVNGLDLFLAHRLAATSEPYDVTRDSSFWARVLSLPADKASSVTVSRTFARLEKWGLVSRDRRGRLARITSLREDGSGHQYSPPGGRWDRYFRLPFAYWENDWHLQLSLPAKAVLLIGMTLNPGFILPEEKGPAWYGISADTIGRGVRELRGHDLLTTRTILVEDAYSKSFSKAESRHTLRPPFHRRRSGEPTLEVVA